MESCCPGINTFCSTWSRLPPPDAVIRNPPGRESHRQLRLAGAMRRALRKSGAPGAGPVRVPALLTHPDLAGFVVDVHRSAMEGRFGELRLDPRARIASQFQAFLG